MNFAGDSGTCRHCAHKQTGRSRNKGTGGVGIGSEHECQKWVVVDASGSLLRCGMLSGKNCEDQRQKRREMDWDPPPQPQTLFSVHLDLLFYIKCNWLKSNK